jgi:CheY-like chemotaxis protein
MPKLLIVDDNEALRRLMRLELSGLYEIIDSGEAEEGLALALEHKPDAILLDLRMPRYSGYDLCQTFTTFSRTQMIPVIIVSGESGGQTEQQCKALGAAAFFEKPIDFDALRTSLRALVKRRRHQPRSEIRVRLNVSLKLKGSTALKKPFEELVMTEEVSLSGFLCSCKTEVALGSVVDVYLESGGQQHVGKAKIISFESKQDFGRSYSCRFIERIGPWVLN